MDNSSSQQNQTQPQPQIQPQPQPQPSSSKNIKNLSIKEFFTTRLMRARSFEGGSQSPKDEASNWFDEFKARMTKKSQASQNKQSAQALSPEDNNDEFNDTGETSVRFVIHKPRGPHYSKDDPSLVKDICDTYLSKLNESCEDLDQTLQEESALSRDTSSLTSNPRSSGLRGRKFQRISSGESADFDTASINTIFNRRDSRYDLISRRPRKQLFSKFIGFMARIVSFLVPLNYNLPWKLLTLINFTFVIILLGLTSKTNPEILAFNFFNGFISGILVATLCFMILFLSILVQILPKSKTTNEGQTSSSGKITDSTKGDLGFVNVTNSDQDTAKKLSEEKLEGCTPSEAQTDSANLSDEIGGSKYETLLEDDSYRGWMIEFIGDYELRNKSDIKLKLIFVKIENKILYLCKPKNSHDVESTAFPVFVQQRIYDLNMAKKFSACLLLPQNVRNRQKWVWSKKYPIRLEFQGSVDQAASRASDASPKNIQLTLFAKSCREKEEWFRRFKGIVEENRLAHGLLNKRPSVQSDLSEENCDNSFGHSMKSLRRSPSPSARCDFVQTSRSSHILNESSKKALEEDKESSIFGSNLVRTKSCELLPTDEGSSDLGSFPVPLDDEATRLVPNADDSTLTRERAELFSQAVEYANFMESRPSLSYREYIERVIESGQEASSTSDWFNAFTGRIFFDVFSHNYWSVWFKRKIQRKLYRIRLPYFMETLTLTRIDLGTNAPKFLNVVSHNFDSFGLSIDFEMAYSGGLTMTFETKLNLLKIKSDSSNASVSSTNISSTPSSPNQSSTSQAETSSKETNLISDLNLENPSKDTSKPSVSSSGSTRTSGESSDSDESDSDSSSDSLEEADVDEISDWEDYGAEKTRQSIVRFVDKIASSRYFQHATENRYIKKKLQDISNCPLVLIVKIESLNGVLTLNIPPPQTDRVWYGFKPNPELTLKALPKMGDREVNLSHVTDWIERKLAEEFRKILVIPNMEDVVLPVLKSDHLLYVTTTK